MTRNPGQQARPTIFILDKCGAFPKRKPDKSALPMYRSAWHADRVWPPPSAEVSDLVVLPPLYSGRRMRVTDDTPSRQVPPRGLGARRGSTQLGQKELALLGQCEPQRGTVSPRPRLRRIGK